MTFLITRQNYRYSLMKQRPNIFSQDSNIPSYCNIQKQNKINSRQNTINSRQNENSWQNKVGQRLLLALQMVCRVRGCLHDTRATFAPGRVHSGSLSLLYICLHDTITKCHDGASRSVVSSPRLSHRGENSTPVQDFATVSCKRETTTRFGVKSVCR